MRRSQERPSELEASTGGNKESKPKKIPPPPPPRRLSSSGAGRAASPDSSGCGCASTSALRQKEQSKPVEPVSMEKVREYKEAFAMLDENCDGLISAGEIKNMFTRIGQPVSDEEVGAMLREIDLDGNEHIDFDEFMQMMLKYESRITPEQYELSLRRVFEIFDLDRNSYITKTELRQVMSKLGKYFL